MKTSLKRIFSTLVACALLLSSLHIGVASAANNSLEQLPDGVYDVPFRYLKDLTSDDSVAQSFVIADSGKLIIQDGKAIFEHEVKKFNYNTFAYFGLRNPGSAKAVIKTVDGEVTPLGIEGYTPAEERESENPENVTISFEIEDVWDTQDILMHIFDEENVYQLPFVYDNWYNAQLQLMVPVQDERASLEAWLEKAEAFVLTGEDSGTAESGAPGRPQLVPISNKEYPINTSNLTGPITLVSASIDVVKGVLNDPDASDEQISEVFREEYYSYNWEQLARQQFLASEVEILALDSVGPTASLSVYADEIGDTATLLEQAGHPYYEGYANITITDHELTATDLRSSNPATTGTFTVKQSGEPSFISTVRPLVSSSTYDDKVYQIPVRTGNLNTLQDAQVWQGLTVVRYPASLPLEEQKTVYISFNKTQLNELSNLLDIAKQIYSASSDSMSADKRSALLNAIENGEETAGQLAAPRTEIYAAMEALLKLLHDRPEIGSKPLYFSAVHAKNDSFSSMENYFDKPAYLVETADRVYVFVTLTGSSSVPEFKVAKYGVYTDTIVIAENSESDTRLVMFEVENADTLDTLIEAQVRTVVPAQNYDRTHNIRLNFNNVDNGELYGLLQSASALLRGATIGTEPGQYPAEAVTALQSAIATAGTEATQNPSTASASQQAKTNLQEALNAFEAAIITEDSGEENTENPGTENPGTENPSEPKYPANGTYEMDFRILKDGTESTSMMQDYVVTTALVVVNGSSKKVSFTVLRSAEITGLKLGGSSGSVTSRDKANNTRVVSFNLSDLSQKIPGWVKIDWDEDNFSYHESYNVQFLFNEASATRVTGGEAPGGNSGGTPDSGVIEEYNNGSNDPKEDGVTEEGNGQTEDSGQDDSSTEQPQGFDVQFSDIEQHWAKSAIQRGVQLGIVNGYSDGSFRPNAQVTRGEFAVMISRALGLNGNADVPDFEDAGNIPTWAQAHVGRVSAAGLLGGFADNTFRSDGQLTRVQLAVIIARAAELTLEDAAPDFVDAGQIPAWAHKEISAAVKAGLIQGKGGNRFAPEDIATRAEALTMIFRLLNWQSETVEPTPAA
ncbi:NEAT domain-containing protein [Paenibacillus sp. IB182496]|uniref:NEAT domain-containing protein n=1 Tax=Paenibacillus sabuli TaxID=2772509 RepID=A0A927BSG0_9BACL|nr:NEAT domain-containing protein [Paenibacillus sabuli]MBD2845076.1 NEAT domain-containing protein [Paenibacillus sabuli]